MTKDFWSNSKVAVIGGGSWGTALAHLASHNVSEVRVWMRNEEAVRTLNSTGVNSKYLSGLKLKGNVKAYTDMERVFWGGVQAVIWVLPSKIARASAQEFAKYFTGEEILIHATKGIEPGSLKRISQVLSEEIPCPRVGVLSGPNLAVEIAKGDPAATVVASKFKEVWQAGQRIFTTPDFRVYSSSDVVGVEWSGTLKNVLALAAGCLDSLGYGWNARAMLISRGLAEMARFGVEMGGKFETFLGLAGVGDLLATCGGPLSRNYRVGFELAKGKSWEQIQKELGATVEGVGTARTVWEFARLREIDMPITEAMYQVIEGNRPVRMLLQELMTRPPQADVTTSPPRV